MFHHRPTVEETAKQVKRDATRGQREIARDILALDREEQKLVLQIKRSKTQSEQRVLAKQVLGVRHEREKLHAVQGKLASVKVTASTMKANHTLGQVMGSTAKAMTQMNKQMAGKNGANGVREFERAMMQQGVNEEMMNDVLSGAFDGEGEEEEVDDVVNQTLLELGVDLTRDMKSAPTHRVGKATAAQVEEEADDAEVERVMREMLRG